MSEKIIYSTVQARVPEKAHNLIKAAAKKHGITNNQAYVDAAMLLAKKHKIKGDA